MVKWKLIYTKQAQKDSKKLSSSNLKPKALKLINILEKKPYQTLSPFERLVGYLKRAISKK